MDTPSSLNGQIMRIIASLLFILLSLPTISQNIKTFQPEITKTLDFGPEAQKEWKLRDKAMNDLTSGVRTWEQLSHNEKALFEKYGEVYENMWDIIGSGCSWYCGALRGKINASSYLEPQGSNSYSPYNTHDLSYKTAWVEGAPGHGVGEYIEYEFPPENPRITTVIIVNGYVKSEQAYYSNSRAKKIKMYVNNKPYAILNLEDRIVEQSFKVDPIGHADRANFESLKNESSIKIRFEILDVYPGNKYEDLAITEIYFDGIDVH